MSLFYYTQISMFGKKKNQNSQSLSQSSDNISVHTMQDDINTMNGKPQAALEQLGDSPSNAQQPTVASAPQETKSGKPFVVTAAKIATSQKQSPEKISDVDGIIPEPNTLDHSSPFADTDSIPPSATSEASQESVSIAAQQLAADNTQSATPQSKSSLPANSPFNAPPANQAAKSLPQTPTVGNPPTLENEISKIQQEYGEIQNSDDTPKAKKASCILFIFIILIILIIAGSGYYYWMSQTPDADTTLVEIGKDTYNDIVNGDDTITKEVDQQTHEYSQTLPHYILIDTQSDTALNDFTQKIETIKENIRTQQPLSAISFIITDENSKPLSFDQFALLTGITLPQEVLDQIDESFLLYGYYDNGEVRLGLSAQTIDPDLVLNAMKDAEPTLVMALRPLFAGEVPETTTPTFTDGIYNQTPIRYANLNTIETLSIDYATYSDDLVIGTSKETIRAIINTL